jgi:hypothetical protein
MERKKEHQANFRTGSPSHHVRSVAVQTGLSVLMSGRNALTPGGCHDWTYRIWNHGRYQQGRNSQPRRLVGPRPSGKCSCGGRNGSRQYQLVSYYRSRQGPQLPQLCKPGVSRFGGSSSTCWVCTACDVDVFGV